MKNHTLTLLFLSLIFLCGCKGINEGVYVYNPLDNALTLKINNVDHVIEMGSMVKIPGEAGTYTIKSMCGDSVLVDTTIELTSELIDNGVLLNTVNESMYLVTEKYGTELMQQLDEMVTKDSAYYARQARLDSIADAQARARGEEPVKDRSDNIIFVDSVLLFGDIKEFPANQVILPREWDIDPNKSFPETVELKANSSETVSGKKISKLFGKKDLIKYYDENDMLIQ